MLVATKAKRLLRGSFALIIVVVFVLHYRNFFPTFARGVLAVRGKGRIEDWVNDRARIPGFGVWARCSLIRRGWLNLINRFFCSCLLKLRRICEVTVND